MSEILNNIDVNSYGLQKMKGGGGSTPNLQSKDVSINENGTTTVTADQGYDGLSDVDVSVSGILDTSDATAVANNIKNGQTAYVNGNKLTGTLPVLTYPINPENPQDWDYQFQEATGNLKRVLRNGYYYILGTHTVVANNVEEWMFSGNSKMKMGLKESQIATLIGLVSNKIKKGEIFLGVPGTYEGEGGNTFKTYLEKPNTFVITIPEGTTEIQSNSFYEYCNKTIWDSNTATITFQYINASIKSLPNSIEVIANYAFGCTNSMNAVNLSQLTEFPASLKFIGKYAFYNNNTLTITTLNCPNLEYIGEYTFMRSLIQTVYLPKIQVLEGSSSMGGAFYNCTSLTEVRLGNNVKQIGRHTFKDCTRLTKIYIDLPRATVEAMPNYQYAFMNDTSKTGIIVCNDDTSWIPYQD